MLYAFDSSRNCVVFAYPNICKRTRKKSGQIGKDKISIFIFQIENSIQIFEDRFVWYHETRDTAQSGLFLFPAEMKKTASKYIAEEEYEEVTF